MKAKLTIIIFLFSTGLYAQNNIDYQKLAKACELWGLIKYFNPDGPSNEFDSAFAANVHKMLEAKNENDWRNLLTEWLNILNDPNTKVLLEEDKITEEGQSYLRAEFETDSTLIIKISGASQSIDPNNMDEFFQFVKEQLAKAKGEIIFDLRQETTMSEMYKVILHYFFEDLNSVLATEIVPQYKRKYYSGFKPENGSTSGDYTINDVFNDAIQPGHFEKRNQRVVWVVNKYSELPVVALSQQASGVGIILADSETITDMIPLSHAFNLSETLSLKFKTTDIVMPDKFQPITDYKYLETDNPIEISRKLLSNTVLQKKEIRHLTKNNFKGNVSYPQDTYPSIGYRILAAAKMFTIIENFFPYYQYMDKDWRNVLAESLPDFVNAKNDIEYGFAVAKMYANINDSHGFIAGNKALVQLRGEAPSPISVDWIENRIVVTQFRNDSICRAIGINIGDIVVKINGVSIDDLMKKYEIYYAHSTKEPLQQQAAQSCIRGPENKEAVFTLQDKTGKLRDIKIKWTNSYNKSFALKHSLDTITLINENIGYADLTRMEAEQTDKMFEKFQNTKAIIFDMRGYPRGTAWSIAPRLTENKNVPLALFRKPEILSLNIQKEDLLSYKSYTEFIQTVETSDKWKYKGKTIMLINQNAISQAEHTGLFFESVNNTMFIGSPTAGANGDVTKFQIPGGIFLYFSGQGVWHADNRQLQRVGLQPHVLVRPTIKGIRVGKDEVLDKAIEWINKNVR